MLRRSQNVFLLLALLMALPSTTFSQSFDPFKSEAADISPPDVVHWEGSFADTYDEGWLVVGLRLSTKQEFTLYQDKVSFTGPAGFDLVKTDAPPTKMQYDPISGKEVAVYSGGEFTLTFRGDKKLGPKTTVKVKYLGCTTRICLFPYTEEVSLNVFPGRGAAPTLGASESTGITEFEQKWAKLLAKGNLSLGMLLLVVFIGGVLTNLTPCVYPMIPITLKLLNKSSHAPLVNSTLYAVGIMLSYTLLGAAAAVSGAPFGTIMASPTANFIFATVMAALGLSMLGFGNFAKLQAWGSRLGAGKPTAKNLLLMGVGAGLVAAPCTGPILGALLAYAASSQWPELTIPLMALYSFGFALPYVLLGNAAARLTKIQVSPHLQVGVKIVFAAVLFALVIYYLRVPFYSSFKNLYPYWPAATLVGGLSGCLLLVIWLRSEVLYGSKILSIVPAAVLAVGVFSGSQWITAPGSAAFSVVSSEAEALVLAEESARPILIDNWAEWCEACKRMDITTFVDQRVVNELEKYWVVAKLDLTESSDSVDVHMDKYKIFGLPTLTLLPSNGDLEARINLVGYQSADSLLKELKAFRGR